MRLSSRLVHWIVVLVLTMVLPAWSQTPPQVNYANRSLKSRKLPLGTPPPKIDADLSDVAWKQAAVADAFVDPQNGKPYSEQTIAYLLYDDVNIYIALLCKDSKPEAIVARETVRDSDMESDDNVRIVFDPYLTRKFNDYSIFTVNPIGTRSTNISGGRAGKIEWQGDWSAVSKKVPEGWVAEIQIPWAILNYPNRRDPFNFGLNFRRWHERTKVESMWSDLGPQRFNERDGTWEAVQTPIRKWKPKPSFLPYFLPIARFDSSGSEFRTGLDIRYQPTQELTTVATINPDFGTLEGAIESIGFSRSQRFVEERRPFFLEGGEFLQLGRGFQLGSFFDPQRIQNVDAGLKLFGKINPKTTVGMLGTVAFGNESNYIAQVRREFGPTSNGSLMFLQRIERGLDNTVLVAEQETRKGKWGLHGQYAISGGRNAEGSAWTTAINLEDTNFFTMIRYQNVGRFFADRLGLISFNDYQGISTYSNWGNNWRKGFWRSFEVEAGITWNWHQNGRPFQRRGFFFSDIQTRSDYQLALFTEGGKFDNDDDFTYGFEIEGNVSNRFKSWGINFTTGRQANLPYTAFGPKFSIRIFKKLDIILNSFIQNYQGVSHQQILTLNYEINPYQSWGGRVVIENGNFNAYLAYKNAGRKGLDTFFIIGDPNAPKFVPQIAVKLVYAL